MPIVASTAMGTVTRPEPLSAWINVFTNPLMSAGILGTPRLADPPLIRRQDLPDRSEQSRTGTDAAKAPDDHPGHLQDTAFARSLSTASRQGSGGHRAAPDGGPPTAPAELFSAVGLPPFVTLSLSGEIDNLSLTSSPGVNDLLSALSDVLARIQRLTAPAVAAQAGGFAYATNDKRSFTAGRDSSSGRATAGTPRVAEPTDATEQRGNAGGGSADGSITKTTAGTTPSRTHSHASQTHRSGDGARR
ncbi:hypothetical protein [Mycolicibacterium aromaticivorans]|uniref:hypothetical protein n=1 Tax=Mycolicibacterium aromaticivorans TaxID=318425 RepID=UPI00044994AF|nr:hypothetical protein [Mycolicibacterium aromaticivorans]